MSTPRIPDIIDHYVDARLRPLWDGRASEKSRWGLKRQIPELKKEITQPFRIANLPQLPPKQGGYPWRAGWSASAIVYARSQVLQQSSQLLDAMQDRLLQFFLAIGSHRRTMDARRAGSLRAHPK